MTFETDVARNGHGATMQLEVGYARFTSISYFFSSVAHTWAGTLYDPRLVSVGRLQRGLTNDHNLASSTVEVVIDNTDGAMDWLVNRDTVETSVFSAKFRLYVVAYDPANPGTLTRKQLGQFGLLDWPRRDPKRITLQLVDDTSIDGAEAALAPSIKDWVTDAASTHGNNPLCKANSTLVDDPFFFLPYEAPAQLAFGNIGIDLQKTAEFELPGTDSNWARRSLILCATTDQGNVTSIDVENFYIRVDKLPDFNQPGMPTSLSGLQKIPKTFTGTANSAGVRTTFTVWSVARSLPLSKDGRIWRIIWVDLNMDALFKFLQSILGPSSELLASGSWRAFGGVPSLYSRLEFVGEGWPYSSRTVQSTASIGFGTGVRAPEVAYDLLAYYSHGLTNADVDLPSFQRAVQVLPGFFASGVIDDMIEISSTREADTSGNATIDQRFQKAEAVGGRLRQVVADLCRSGSFDIFVSWDGVFKATAQTSSFTDQIGASALLELDEMLIVDGDWEDRVPSTGERWAPHNRLYIEGLHGRIGPFDNAAKVTAWGRKLPFTLSTKWVSPADYALIAANPNLALFNTSAVEAKARQRVRFTYGSLEALQLDVGSYFKISLKRGTLLNPVFSSAVFKIEQIDLLPSTMGVYIEAIWFDDLTSDRPYFLDDESYSLVVASTPGRTVTVTDNNTLATWSSGDLLADGVLAGDILVLKDSGQAANIFTRYRAVRITAPGTSAVFITDPSLDFSAPGGAAVTTWEIHRGATTYSLLAPTTNYPTTDYPPLYGKVTNSISVFSDSSAGNKLLDG